MNIVQQRALVQRWQALDAALTTIVPELRTNPAHASILDTMRHPAYTAITEMMAGLLRQLGAPTEPVHYVLLLHAEDDGDPSVMQVIQCRDYADHEARYRRFREELDTTTLDVLPTPDGHNEFNGVTTMQIDPEKQP